MDQKITKNFRTFSDLPAYDSESGTLSGLCNCGPGLADDRESTTDSDSFQYIIGNTNEPEFERFLAAFSASPCRVEQNEAGRYAAFRIDEKIYYVYYLFSDQTTHIIQDRSSNCLPHELNLPRQANSQPLQLYQYSLNYVEASVPYAEEGCIDCGMLYILRFSDGSLMLVDSAHDTQITEASQAGLYRFLRRVSGVPEQEKIPVRAWFFTHAHGDHCGLAATFLGETYPAVEGKPIGPGYADQLDVQAVLFNFPSYHVAVGSYAPDETMAMKKAFRENYRDVRYCKLHTGQKFSVLGVDFEVLYTFEDSFQPDGSWGLQEFNSTSTVLKITENGHSLLLLADTAKASEKILLKHYTEATLRSELVQVAHHCINELDIYDTIRPCYALAPTSYQRMTGRLASRYARFRDWCTGGVYCADAVTWGITFEPEKLVFSKLPRYDAQSEVT